MATSSSAVQTDTVLKDDRTSTDECCEVTPKSQLAQTFSRLMAKPLGVKTPGWTPRFHQNIPVGVAGSSKAEKLTGNARSFRSQPQNGPSRRWD